MLSASKKLTSPLVTMTISQRHYRKRPKATVDHFVYGPARRNFLVCKRLVVSRVLRLLHSTRIELI